MDDNQTKRFEIFLGSDTVTDFANKPTRHLQGLREFYAMEAVSWNAYRAQRGIWLRDLCDAILSERL